MSIEVACDACGRKGGLEAIKVGNGVMFQLCYVDNREWLAKCKSGHHKDNEPCDIMVVCSRECADRINNIGKA